MVAAVKERILDATGRGNDGSFHIVKEQDVEPILKALRAIPDHVCARKAARASTKHIASIPNVIALSWAQETGTRLYSKEWMAVVSRKLNDPLWKKLKLEYTR